MTDGDHIMSDQALPAIRPVNHVVDDGEIIIRTRLSSKVARAVWEHAPAGRVIAYQADGLDPMTRLGWSVAATGTAHPVTDPERIARYEQLLRPWANQVMDTVLGIRPEIITGYRLVDAEDPAGGV
jgi:hypothetical protein